MANVAAGWYPDPTGRFDRRYWDGSVWTDFAARGGVQSQDPVTGEASVGPLPEMSSPAGLGLPAATSAGPSRSTKVKVLWLAGVPALIVAFFLIAVLLPPPTYYGGQELRFLLWTIGLVGLIGLIAFVVVAVKTRRPFYAVLRGFAWIALSLVTIGMLPGTAIIALIAVAKWFPVSSSDPFQYHQPNVKAIVKQYFEVWSWIGHLLGFTTNFGASIEDRSRA